MFAFLKKIFGRKKKVKGFELYRLVRINKKFSYRNLGN